MPQELRRRWGELPLRLHVRNEPIPRRLLSCEALAYAEAYIRWRHAALFCRSRAHPRAPLLAVAVLPLEAVGSSSDGARRACEKEGVWNFVEVRKSTDNRTDMQNYRNWKPHEKQRWNE